MAEATVELRNLLKTDFELFDFDYQFDDQEFKKELEQAIIDHYFFYEISGYTPDQFKHRFRTRWQRIIKHYNRLYNTTLLEYNPLVNYSMEEALEQLSRTSRESENKENATSNTEGNSHTLSDNISKDSDYPQQPIAGGDFLSGENNTIVDSTVEDTSTTTGESTTTGKNSGTDNTEYTKTIEGLTGTSYQELIQKERQNLIRITSMIIEEMKPCFILIY